MTDDLVIDLTPDFAAAMSRANARSLEASTATGARQRELFAQTACALQDAIAALPPEARGDFYRLALRLEAVRKLARKA